MPTLMSPVPKPNKPCVFRCVCQVCKILFWICLGLVLPQIESRNHSITPISTQARFCTTSTNKRADTTIPENMPDPCPIAHMVNIRCGATHLTPTKYVLQNRMECFIVCCCARSAHITQLFSSFNSYHHTASYPCTIA